MTPGGEPPTVMGRQTGWSVDLRLGTVQILDAGGRPAGAGFLVGEDLLVTCAHVLDSYQGDGDSPTNSVSVRFLDHADGDAQAARVEPQLWRSPDAEDVAFLRLADAPPPGSQVLPLGASVGIRGHSVRTYGFAGNVPSAGAYDYGVAGDQIRGAGNVPLLQLTDCGAVTEGFSGGPVLDERTGLVVGMVNSISGPDPLRPGGDIAFALPTEVLREICSELTLSEIRPYRGLEPFTVVDAPWFHGRGRAVDAVLACLRPGRRFLALLGPSGSGKSSLIHAGVLPALAEGRIPGSDQWGWVSVRPGAEPFAALERAGLPGARAGLGAAAQRWFAEHPDRNRLVLVFDQCEELFTTTPERLRQTLFDQLITLTGQQPVTVVMVLRDDFYSRMAAAAPGLMELMQQALVNIPAQVDADELRAIIERPAELAGLTLEPNLAERIAGDAALEAPGVPSGSAAITVLPLLEFALTELWRRREDGRLTHGAYERIGGVAGGLARWCDEAYKSLPVTLQPLARRVITSLVRLGDENANIPPTRRRRLLTDLYPEGQGKSQDSDRDIDRVVAALADRRLLITSRDPTSGQPIVELVHDALIREWDQLAQWLARDHDFLTWRQDLESDYEQWNTSTGKRTEHDSERLLPKGALDEALRWSRLRESDLADKFKEYIRLSDRQRRIQARRRVYGRVIVAVLLVVATIYSARKAQDAANERNLAQSRQLAANAQDQLTIDPERSVLLAREAHKVRDTPEAEAAVRQATLDSQVRAMLRGHQGTVFGVAFSADGKRVVSGGDDGTVRVWDASGAGAPVVLRACQRVFGVAFSADGKRVASACGDGTVRVWDASGAGNPVVLRGHRDAVLSVAFSADGKRVASAGEDRTVRVWDASGVGDPVVLKGHQGRVYGVAFSPDGKVASASADSTVRVWDVSGASQRAVLSGQQGVYSVAFSPDGKRIVSAGKDATVRVWDASGTGKPLELPGHDDAVLGVAFSPDGQRVVSASADSTVRLWDASGAGDPVVLRGHQGKVYGVAFSPDGKQVVSAGKDAMVRVWDVSGAGDPVALTGHQGTVYGVAFSPDGKQVVSGGDDGTVRVWDVSGAVGPIMLRGHQGRVYSVAFSPDGKRVASASADGTVRVWDVSGAGAELAVLRGHQGQVQGVAFSPDGKRIASAGEDSTVRVWDVSGAGAEPVVLRGHQGQVQGVAFSPDGKRIASASGDTTVRVWDASGVGNPVVLTGNQGTVYSVAFSPDGMRVASAGADTTVQVWDASGSENHVVLAGGHHGTVYRVAFSRDGKWIASAGADSTVRVWDSSGTGYPVVLHDRHAVRGVALSLDGKRVASGSVDGMVRLWSCEVCRQFEHVLTLAEMRSTRELNCTERTLYLQESPCPSP
jgi:WD40 repeat protein